MIEEKVLVEKFLNRKERPRLKKPDWLKIKLGDPSNQNAVLDLIEGLNLHTVCQEA
jgi:lipoate synthase